MSRVHYAVLAIPVAGLAAAGGYWYAMSRMPAMPAEPAAAKPATQGDRKVLYWYDPMFPQQKFDKPGKSPFMDMQLVPKYADEGGDEGTVSISPRVVQNLGVRTAEARRGSLATKLAAVGNVEFNERAVAVVQPRDRRLRRATLRARAARPGARGRPAGRDPVPGVGGRAGRIPGAEAPRRTRRRGAPACGARSGSSCSA